MIEVQPIEVDIKKLKVLPPPKGCCQVCGEKAHTNAMPHNRDTLYYQFKFYERNGRTPTWADAAAECSLATRRDLKKFLKENGIPDQLIGNL